jgi:chorismate lyase/3-hydroxybenzoate synthase
VGHESAYPFDVVRQVGETVQNLGELWQAGSTVGLTERRLAPGGKYIVRIYVRNPADYPVVARELQGYLGANVDHAIFLHGDICRKDLMVEIDGVSIQSLQPHSAVSS